MIVLQNLTKIFWTKGLRKIVLNDVNATLPSGRAVALLGRNGAGKSTLMNLISGTMDPTSGQILTSGSISWPVGFAGSFHPELTGLQNTRFIARIYGVDTSELVEFVEAFAELGRHYRQPIRTYSSGMRARLAFGVSMGIPFDTYLVDEVMSVGDASFREKSTAVFSARMRNAGAVVVSHNMGIIRKLCDSAVVLEGGRLTHFDCLDEAIEYHEGNMRRH